MSVQIGSIVTELTGFTTAKQPGPRPEFAAYVVVSIVVDGKLLHVGTMVGVMADDRARIRDSGVNVWPFCRTWFIAASDHQAVPPNRKDAVTVALFEARHRLWQEVTAFRLKHQNATHTAH